MITKGIVMGINKNNTLSVRIPIFEAASNARNNQIVDCTVCYNPGNLNGYKVEDVVFVAFEDNKIDKPVVIGKLYLGEEKEATNSGYMKGLEVTGNASLPASTTIGGLTFEDIKGLIYKIEHLNSYIEQVGEGSDISVTQEDNVVTII